MRKTIAVAGILGLFLTVVLFAAQGVTPSQPSSAEVQALKDQVSRLEARVAALEKWRAATGPPAPPAPQRQPLIPHSDPDGYGNIQFQLVPTADDEKGKHPAPK